MVEKGLGQTFNLCFGRAVGEAIHYTTCIVA
jgi:hypothetical protein